MLRARSEPEAFEPASVLSKDHRWIARASAPLALVDQVEVIPGIVIAQDPAEMGAAPLDQAVVAQSLKEGRRGEQRIGWVSRVREHLRAAPRKEMDPSAERAEDEIGP